MTNSQQHAGETTVGAPGLDLKALDAEPLPATTKGLAQRAVGQPLSALGDLGLSLLAGDLPFPVALLKESALAHNSVWMRSFVDRAGAVLCPHGKTTMSPQLFDRQLRSGDLVLVPATLIHRGHRQVRQVVVRVQPVVVRDH